MITKHKCKIVDNKLVISSLKRFNQDLTQYEGRDVFITIEKFKKRTTDPQRRALHLWFGQMAGLLNETGWDMRKALKAEVDIIWTKDTFKEIWRQIQIEYCGKKSTNDLTSEEITAIYDILNKAISEKTGLSLPFPCLEVLMAEDWE